MSNTSDCPLFDPASGSGSLLLEALQSVSSSYNKVSLSRLATEQVVHNGEPMHSGRLSRRRRHQAQQSQFLGAENYKSLLMAYMLVDDDEPFASQIKIGAWDETEQLSGRTSFAYSYTSSALDLCTVDTLWIALPISSLVIRDDHQLTIWAPEPEAQHGVLWYDSKGNSVTGKWASWIENVPTEKGSHATIRLRIRRRAWIGGDGVGCLLQLEMPAIVGNGDNSWPLNKAFAVAVIKSVQERLRSIGVEADLRQGQVVRCDLNRDIVLDAPCESYELLFRALDQPRTHKNLYGSTGFSCINKSQSTLLYDKIARMKKAGWRTDHLPPNLVRLEWQVKRAKNVREKLGVNTVQDLCDNWYDLPALYHAHKEAMFCYDVEEMQKPQPRLERRGLDAIQAQCQNTVRWCTKRNLILGFTADDLERIIRQGHIREYERIMKSLPGMTKADLGAATDLVGRMRRAFWQVSLRNPEFVAQYEEVRSKCEGGKCWPYLSVEAQREIDKQWT